MTRYRTFGAVSFVDFAEQSVRRLRFRGMNIRELDETKADDTWLSRAAANPDMIPLPMSMPNLELAVKDFLCSSDIFRYTSS